MRRKNSNNKRWGKKQKKKRNWRAYHEKLVRRGELLIPSDKTDDWLRELNAMNKGKEGAVYLYSDQLIECLALMKCTLKLPYRAATGFGCKLLQLGGITVNPDPSTLCRRFRKLGKKYYSERKKFKDDDPLYVVFDGTGLKVCNRGEWMHYKHKGKRKGFVRVCFMFDTKTGEMLDFSATTEKVGEQDKIRPMIKRTARNRNIGKLGVDGAGDDARNFELLKFLKIKPAIKIRKNADPNPACTEGKKERLKEVRKYKKWGYKKWTKRREYGQRWQGETGIGCFKGYFGEYVFSKGMSNIKAEVGLKAHFYNQLRLM